jgi:methylmalonyl-CoA mutase cobalamin-binding subunit
MPKAPTTKRQFRPDGGFRVLGGGLNNGNRALRAEATLRAFSGTADAAGISTLLADMMHLCDREGWDFRERLSLARENHRKTR